MFNIQKNAEFELLSTIASNMKKRSEDQEDIYYIELQSIPSNTRPSIHAPPPEKTNYHKYRKYCLIILCLLILGVLYNRLKSTSAYQLTNWMSKLDAATSIDRISIPGSHNTAALFGPPKHVNQNLTLDQQLNFGIRYLDIRCRHIEDRFDIHHGSTYQNLTFDQVLSTIKDFLRRNPSEVLIMRLKPEFETVNCTRDFSDTFFTRYWDPSLFYEGTDIPTLKDAGGKIYLLKNFEGGKAIGTSWEKITSTLQDDYKVYSLESKKESIEDFYQRATHRPADEIAIYINHISGSGDAGFATEVSQEMNKIVLTFTNKLCGVIAMDFVNESLSKHLISLNFASK